MFYLVKGINELDPAIKIFPEIYSFRSKFHFLSIVRSIQKKIPVFPRSTGFGQVEQEFMVKFELSRKLMHNLIDTV